MYLGFGDKLKKYNPLAEDIVNSPYDLSVAGDGSVTGTFNSETGVFTVSGTGAMGDNKQTLYSDIKNSITKVVIEEGVTYIGSYAFYYCENLTQIEISSTIESIGLYASSGNRKIESINVNENNKNFSSQDGILFNKDKTTIIQYPSNKSGESYVIPDSVTQIGNIAFEGCFNLKEVTIPNSVISIGHSAFNFCIYLTDIQIPLSVTNIGNYAFDSCVSLETINIPISVTGIGENIFSNCVSLTTVKMPITIAEEKVFGKNIYQKNILEDSSLFLEIIPEENILKDLNLYLTVTPNETNTYEGKIIEDVTSGVNHRSNNCSTQGSKVIIEEDKLEEAEILISSGNNANLHIKFAPVEEEQVEIQFDQKMYTKIVPQLGDKIIAKDDINHTVKMYKGIMEAVTSLQLNNAQIQNISGIENFIGLKELNLSDNRISYIGALSELIKLEDLDLSLNSINNINDLSRLTKLLKLNLRGNRISNIEVLSRLTALEELDLHSNAIRDISVLAQLPELTSLNLGSTGFSDGANILSGLTTLKKLYLDGYETENVSYIKGLTNLEILSLEFCNISNISDLSNLTSLKELNLFGNKISDISAIAGLNELNADKLNLGVQQIELKTAEEIELPQIFKEAKRSGSKVYTDSDYTLTGCTINGTKVILNDGVDEATVTINGGTADGTILTIHYETIPVESVTLNKSTLTLEEGKTETLTTTIAPSNATNQDVTWSSSNTAVATVQNGTVTAIGEGTATITVTSQADETKKATCMVTVTKKVVPVESITLNKNSLTLEEDKTEKLTVTIAPSNATNQDVIWSSNNTEVATVEQDGTVTAVSEGTAQITVFSQADTTKKAACIVRVTKKVVPVESVTLNKTELTLEEGKTETLTATVLPTNASNKTVTWTSTNPNVATVQNGIVTAVGAGTAQITVASQADTTKTATCIVTVREVEEPKLAEEIRLNKEIGTLNVGEEETLIVRVIPEDASNKDDLEWTSTNEEVATVDEEGKITAISAGTVTVRVTVRNTDIYAEYNLTVIAPVQEISVDEVTLNKYSLTLEKGKTETLTVIVLPANASNKAVTWSSNNPNVATVQNGIVTAVGAGTAQITVTSQADTTKKATCQVTVTETQEPEEKLRIEITETDYIQTQEEEKIYIEGIQPETMYTDFIQKIETNGQKYIYDKSNNEIEPLKIATGMKLVITKGEETKEFTLVVRGDTNGDSKANFTDMLKINKHRLKKVLLEGANLKAGDINGDGVANFTDMLKINKFRLKKVTKL